MIMYYFKYTTFVLPYFTPISLPMQILLGRVIAIIGHDLQRAVEAKGSSDCAWEYATVGCNGLETEREEDLKCQFLFFMVKI